MPPMITLTTDFGITEEYVGVMKGVILTRAPQAQIIDLTHGIPPQGITQAAHIVSGSWKYFPKKSIHAVIVDPGVGTDRKVLLAEREEHFFLAPDNGLLSFLRDDHSATSFFEVTANQLFLQPVSATFQGRDIFAPVAAALANGLLPDVLGRSLSPKEIVAMPPVRPVFDAARGELTGEIILIDHFGNAMTNISRESFSKHFSEAARTVATLPKNELRVKLYKTYNSVEKKQPLAHFGSRNFLEISVNCDNAARLLDISLGDTVIMSEIQ